MWAKYLINGILERYSVTNLPHGLLIAFEGIDGAGKSVQIQAVANRLRELKYTVTVTHEPNPSSPYTQLIKEHVRKGREKTSPEKELEWYTLDRKWDVETNILPALKKKHLVLVDRYYLSSAAYQGALNAFSLEYVLEKNSFAPRPDLWLILDVPVKLGQSRLQLLRSQNVKEDDELEISTYQEKVLENYKALTKMNIGGEVIWVDASGDEVKLTEEIVQIILEFIRKRI